MSVLKLLNLQKFLKYKMENIATCCAWCATKGSCVTESFQGGREGTAWAEESTESGRDGFCVKDD